MTKKAEKFDAIYISMFVLSTKHHHSNFICWFYLMARKNWCWLSTSNSNSS